MLSRSKISVIALDSGPTSLSLCQLARSRGKLLLHKWGVLEDPLRERPASTGFDDRLGERLQRIVRQAGFEGRRASIALKPPDVSLLPAQVPEALLESARAQVLATLRLEAARQMQCDPELLEIDYWRLPPRNRSGSNVMIAAVKRDAVLAWSSIFDKSHLSLVRVDVQPWALTRAAWREGIPGRGERPAGECLWGILDVGFSSSVLTIALGNQCVYVRHSPIGGDSLTAALSEGLQVDYRTAETLKRECATLGAESAAEGMGDVSNEVRGILRGRIRALAAEIERAFSYALENYADATPTGVYLCGGGARLHALDEMLRGLLGVDVQLLKVGAALEAAPRQPLPPDAQRPTLATCLGLALGDLE